MNIFISRRGEIYCADFCDLTGTPEIGLGRTEDEAIEDLKAKHYQLHAAEGPHTIKRYG